MSLYLLGGNQSSNTTNRIRKTYIDAIHATDERDIQALVNFARE